MYFLLQVFVHFFYVEQVNKVQYNTIDHLNVDM